jgi:hypothetical protein
VIGLVLVGDARPVEHVESRAPVGEGAALGPGTPRGEPCCRNLQQPP